MNTSFQTYWRELANGRRTGAADRLLTLLLAPFSLVYSRVLYLRSLLYRSGILKSYRLPRPVISIGNITIGGTGKTPVTAFIALRLLEQGYRVAVISRGYGGALEGQTCIVSDGATIMMSARECGDEPYLLASTMQGLMVVIGTDRHAAGMLAMQQLAPDIFLLDDGFQHLRLQRDLNILLLDHFCPFGNGWTLPGGMLRESASARGRADLIIVTRHPEGSLPTGEVSETPLCTCHHHIRDLMPLSGGVPLQFPHLGDSRLLAFAGIADPDSFFNELESRALNIVHRMRLPDHSTYTKRDLNAIVDAMSQSGAELAITTEKDGVKLFELPEGIKSRILLARLELVFDNPSVLDESLRNLLQKQL